MHSSLKRIIRYYDQRAGNHRDLHTKAAFAAGRSLAHYHAGIAQHNDRLPASDKDALAWFHERQNATCDLIWSIAAAFSSLSRILDMGCGVGGTLRRFSELAAGHVEAAGITLSSKEQTYAQQFLPDATILAGNLLDDVRVPERWFSLIVAIEAVEHLPGEFIELLMRRAHTLLAPKGLFVVVARLATSCEATQSEDISQINSYCHTRITTAEAYLAAAGAAGLRLTGEIDLTSQVALYWKIRYEHELFQNSKDGWLERCVYRAFQQGQLNYKLYTWMQD